MELPLLADRGAVLSLAGSAYASHFFSPPLSSSHFSRRIQPASAIVPAAVSTTFSSTASSKGGSSSDEEEEDLILFGPGSSQLSSSASQLNFCTLNTNTTPSFSSVSSNRLRYQQGEPSPSPERSLPPSLTLPQLFSESPLSSLALHLVMGSSTNILSSSQISLPLGSSSTPPIHPRDRAEITKAFGYKGGAGFLERPDVKLLADQLKNGSTCDDCSVRGLLEDQRELLNSLEGGPVVRGVQHESDLDEGGAGAGGGRRRGRDGREGSLRELTRRASEEDELLKGDHNSAKKRRDSVSKAAAAGLGSPFSGSAGAASVTGGGGGAGIAGPTTTTKKYPPVTNSAAVTVRPSRKNSGRSRSSSRDSTQSLSKDVMLNELAQALRNERKRCEEYEAEILAIEEENDEIRTSADVMKEKFSNRLQKQEQTIQALRLELDELRAELEIADNLDEKEAEQYLALLGRSPPHSNSSPFSSSPEPEHLIGASTISFPTSRPTVPVPAPTTRAETVKPSATQPIAPLSKAGRRIANRLRAYSSDTEAGPELPSTSVPRAISRPRRLSKPPSLNRHSTLFRDSPSSPTISKPTLIRRSSPEVPTRLPPTPQGGASPGPPLVPVLSDAEFGKIGGVLDGEKAPASGIEGLEGIRRAERKMKATKPPVSGLKTRERKGSFGAAFTSTLSKLFPAHNQDGNRRAATHENPDDLENEIQSWVKKQSVGGAQAGYAMPT